MATVTEQEGSYLYKQSETLAAGQSKTITLTNATYIALAEINGADADSIFISLNGGTKIPLSQLPALGLFTTIEIFNNSSNTVTVTLTVGVGIYFLNFVPFNTPTTPLYTSLTSPLDANGNLKVDLEAANATVPVSGTVNAGNLPEDSSGNLKVDLETDSTGQLANISNFTNNTQTRLTYTYANTTTPLGANAVFVSGWYGRSNSSNLNGLLKAFAVSDQSFTLYVDYSLANSTVDYSVEAASAAISSPYVAGSYGSQFAKIVDEFIDYYPRLRIVNGSTAQTYLRAQLVLEGE